LIIYRTAESQFLPFATTSFAGMTGRRSEYFGLLFLKLITREHLPSQMSTTAKLLVWRGTASWFMGFFLKKCLDSTAHFEE
jgi:hypothetical protein